MSAFMVSNVLMQKVVTAVLQNTDEFATIPTFRGQLVDDPPTDAQCKAAEDIGKRLFGMNAAAIKARYGFLPQRPVFKFAGWADGNPSRAVQGNSLPALPILRGHRAQRSALRRTEPGRRRACPADRAGLARLRESPLGLKAVEPGTLHAVGLGASRAPCPQWRSRHEMENSPRSRHGSRSVCCHRRPDQRRGRSHSLA